MSDENRESLALSLSGGGFRATIFHLGVVAYLRQSGLLQKVDRVISVSGGSILAAHLALNWHKYVSTEDKSFHEAARAIIKLCQIDLRGRIVRLRLLYLAALLFLTIVPLSFAWLVWSDFWTRLWVTVVWGVAIIFLALYLRNTFSLAQFLRNEYDRFFRGDDDKSTKLADLNSVDNSPQFYLLTTNFTSGCLAWFDSDGLTLCNDNGQAEAFANKHLPLSIAVAASSAFPPAFAPLQVTYKTLRTDQARLQHPQYLGDGGVYDNLGLSALKLLPQRQESAVIVSSAERRFDLHLNEAFTFLPVRATRASDILMQRVSVLTTASALPAGSAPPAFLAKELPENWLTSPMQNIARNVRTDLDRFSSAEIQLLFHYGFGAAKLACEGNCNSPPGISHNDEGVPAGTANGYWLPFDMQDGHVRTASADSLSSGSRVKLALWSLSDWKSWLTLIIVLATLAFSYPSLSYYKSRPRLPQAPEFAAFEYTRFDWRKLRPPGSTRTSTPERIIKYASEELGMSDCESGVVRPAIFIGNSFGESTDGRPPTEFELEVKPYNSKIQIGTCRVFVVSGDNKGILEADRVLTGDPDTYRYHIPRSAIDSRTVILISFCDTSSDRRKLEDNFTFTAQHPIGDTSP